MIIHLLKKQGVHLALNQHDHLPRWCETAWDLLRWIHLLSMTVQIIQRVWHSNHTLCVGVTVWLIVMCNFRWWWEFMQQFIVSSIIMFQFEQCWHVVKIAWVSAGLLFDSCGFKVCMDEPLWASFYPGCVTVSGHVYMCQIRASLFTLTLTEVIWS